MNVTRVAKAATILARLQDRLEDSFQALSELNMPLKDVRQAVVLVTRNREAFDLMLTIEAETGVE